MLVPARDRLGVVRQTVTSVVQDSLHPAANLLGDRPAHRPCRRAPVPSSRRDRDDDVTAPTHKLSRRHDLRAWTVFTVVALLLLATVPLATAASAQLPALPDPGLPPAGEGEEEPGAAQPDGEGLKTAYWTAPVSDVFPNTVVSEFPPGVVCILFPEACGEGTNPLTAPVQDLLVAGIDGLDQVASADSPQPVPPGTLPLGILSGNQRYSSGLGIPLPALGEDKVFGELLITLQMTDYAFAVESPAFRELVNAVLSQATANSGPEPFQALLQNIAGGTTPPFTTDFPGLEMCVITADWAAGESQPVADQPAVDPLACSERVDPAEDGTVTFDMTFIANSTLDGFLPAWQGVIVRPLEAQNLAFGDRDYTTNYLAYLEDPAVAPPTVTSTEVDGPPPPLEGGPPAAASGVGGGSGSSGSSGSAGLSGISGSSGTSSGTQGSTGGSSAPAPSGTSDAAPIAETSTEDIAVPETAGDDAVLADESVDSSPLADSAPTDVASSGWIPYVLLPMLLGGALWYGRVLDAPPAESVTRSGAMTRLLRQRGFAI